MDGTTMHRPISNASEESYNQTAHEQQLNDFKKVIKCVAAFAQIGSDDIDKMDLGQVNTYLERLQDEAMLKFMMMVNEPLD